MARPIVLDASAVLAVLFNELGSDAVAPLLNRAAVSAVSLAEAHAHLVRRGVEAHRGWRGLIELGCEVCPFEEEQARLAGEMVSQTRYKELSLGDRACLALAIQRNAAVYTTDAAWQNLGLGIEVEVIR